MGSLDLWREVAAQARAFLEQEGVLAADALVLLPFAQLLPLARAGWASVQPSGWMPRFETARTLADSLVPPAHGEAGGPTGDMLTDRLRAAQLLAGAVPDWSARDARGFDLAVRRLVDLAHGLADARAATPPLQREAWAAAARQRLAAGGGPASAERTLARLALEWSLQASTAAADALFALRPGAWLGLRVGARDPLAESLLAAAEVPALWLEADRDPAAPPAGEISLAPCSDAEDEAQRAAAAVLEQLGRPGPRDLPVALVALDRLLVRRVSALLHRQGVPLADETGWKLSTTRAAACVVGLLRALAPGASADELIEVLKSMPAGVDGSLSAQAVDALEAELRRKQWTELAQVHPEALGPRARGAWESWAALSKALAAGGRASLDAWLERLSLALQAAGLLESLAADAAGVELLRTLRLGPWRAADTAPRQAFQALARETRLSQSGFRTWIEGALEQASFRPAATAQPSVVITPLARALLRPFAAVVCPGADPVHLGANPEPDPLLGDALAVALGLPGTAARREAEAQAFAQLARCSPLTLLYREADGAEPLGASPLLLRWKMAAAREGRELGLAPDPRTCLPVPARPTRRPAPSAPALLPQAYSASRYEQLRACPYRFYALSMLGLGEVDELDDELEKREVGNWLHEVLEEFHDRRTAAASLEVDLASLHAVAAELRARQFSGAGAIDFLPFADGFEALAPRYIDWLHRAEAEGWTLQASEVPLRAELPPEAAEAAAPIVIHGRLDRVDRRTVGVTVGVELKGDRDGGEGLGAAEGSDRTDRAPASGERLRLIDYKFRSGSAVRRQARLGLEDTQLAFYAALALAQQSQPSGGLEAGYLALEDREAPTWEPHPGVEDSARALVQGLAHDVLRLRAGVALPALGDGAACEHCAARGLCRRDHWEAA